MPRSERAAPSGMMTTTTSGAAYARECTVPPEGWRCTRGYHSDGPCAAVPRVPGLSDDVEKALIDHFVGKQTFKIADRHIEFMPPDGTWGTITHCIVYGFFRRSWRERLLTLPWRPWRATERQDLWCGPIGPITC